jgi:hypothetical protein
VPYSPLVVSMPSLTETSTFSGRIPGSSTRTTRPDSVR